MGRVANVWADDDGDDERLLVERARYERRAFAPLYDRYAEPVYRYAYRRLGDPERAADATSQVFLQALAALPRFRGGSFRSWLFAIAHNVVADSHRRSGRTAELPAAWDAPDPEPSPEHQAIRNDEAAQLVRLLGRLTAEQREVVELRLAGLTGQEIADRLGRSLTSAVSLQWRAFARLRRLLADDDAGRPSLHPIAPDEEP